MVGKDCFAIACDLRLGMQSIGISNNFEKIFSYGGSANGASTLYLGLTGLATDVITLSEVFRQKPTSTR